MPATLYDNHGRPIEYVRLAVTDRCNLRCFYCMPAEGIRYLPRHQVLSFEEMERLLRLLAQMGITKVRITGGEPFVRRDLMDFMERIAHLPGIEKINLTTNGVLTGPFVPRLRAMGIHSVNLSLDALDRANFHRITRRDELPRVLDTFQQLVAAGIRTKINAVVMDGQNIEELVPLALLSRDYPVDVRFIEEMPFNGEGSHYPTLHWHHGRILDHLNSHFPDIRKVPDEPHATARCYQIPGHRGTVGIIAAFTRTFCGTCNRIRITAQGTLKTCLYDEGVLDLRALLRDGSSDTVIADALRRAFAQRPRDGYEAEARRQGQPAAESMSTIGG